MAINFMIDNDLVDEVGNMLALAFEDDLERLKQEDEYSYEEDLQYDVTVNTANAINYLQPIFNNNHINVIVDDLFLATVWATIFPSEYNEIFEDTPISDNVPQCLWRFADNYR